MLSFGKRPAISRHRYAALGAFLLLIAGQLMALPAELWSGGAVECVMACSLEDRDCCCKQLFGDRSREPVEGVRLERPPHEDGCGSPSAVFEKQRGEEKLALLETQGDRTPPAAPPTLIPEAWGTWGSVEAPLPRLPRPPPFL